MITKTHHFFLLPNSIWPIFSSICSLNFMSSIIWFFKNSEFFFLLTNFSLLFLVSFFWWSNYVKEFEFSGWSSKLLEFSLKYSMILFISSEIWFFFSFFWSYFHFFLSPVMEIGGWPSFSILMFNCMDTPIINTLILLSSGLTVTLSHNFFNFKKIFLSCIWLLITIILGLTFTLLQYSEYKNSFFSISDSSYGTVFFMLTGFHGIHVIIGTIFLMFSLKKSMKMEYSSEILSFEMASWYWHFVDVVWLFLYFFVYYLNN